jgi:hypothetical protein
MPNPPTDTHFSSHTRKGNTKRVGVSSCTKCSSPLQWNIQAYSSRNCGLIIFNQCMPTIEIFLRNILQDYWTLDFNEQWSRALFTQP